MIHLDPDFQNLSKNQREIALKCLYTLSNHGNINRDSGITQIKLIHAIGSTLLGVEIANYGVSIDNREIHKLSVEFKDVKESVRHRLFQLFTLVELMVVIVVIGIVGGIIFSGAGYLFEKQAIKQATVEVEVALAEYDQYKVD